MKSIPFSLNSELHLVRCPLYRQVSYSSRMFFLPNANFLFLSIANVQVIMGAVDRTIVEPTQVRQTMMPARINNHPSYNPSNLNNDISTIHLNSAVGFTNAIQAIPMPTRAQAGESFAGVTATVSGFGRTSDASGATSAIVRWVTAPVITNAACAAVYGGNVVVASVICISTEGGRGTCNGDSGGPLNFNGRQIGVVSFGAAAGCERGFPAGFARTTSFLDFIQTNSDLTIT
jgi:chymotrypsin